MKASCSLFSSWSRFYIPGRPVKLIWVLGLCLERETGLTTLGSVVPPKMSVSRCLAPVTMSGDMTERDYKLLFSSPREGEIVLLPARVPASGRGICKCPRDGSVRRTCPGEGRKKGCLWRKRL